MNYGQDTRMPDASEVGFTAGIGSAPEDTNPLVETENLNSDVFGLPKNDQSMTNNRALVGKAGLSMVANEAAGAPERTPIHEPEVKSDFLQNMPMPSQETDSDHPSRLGQVIDMPTPPLFDEQPSVATVSEEGASQHSTDQTASFTEVAKHFADAKINVGDIPYIKSIEDKLAQDGNADSFYEFWREARLDAITGIRGKKAV